MVSYNDPMVKKRIGKISIITTLIMCLSITGIFASPVFAEDNAEATVEAATNSSIVGEPENTTDAPIDAPAELSNADILNLLGFFSGTNKGYELEKCATRAEAITMLVRVLGKEDEAKNGDYTHPFTDVPKWANVYVAYAYDNNLASGTSSTKFGPGNKITAAQFTALILRALGYKDSKGDFRVSTALDKALAIGLINSEQYAQINKSEFTRGLVVDLIYAVLSQPMKNNSITFLDTLIIDGVIDTETALEYGFKVSDPAKYPAYILYRAEENIVEAQDISDLAVSTADDAKTKATAAKELADKYINVSAAKAKATEANKHAEAAHEKADQAKEHAKETDAIVTQTSKVAASKDSKKEATTANTNEINAIVAIAEDAQATARDARRKANEAKAYATNAQKNANEAKVLATTPQEKKLNVPWKIISQIGKQPRGMCSAYSIAYSRAIIEQKYKSPYSYWNGSGAVWSAGGGKDRRYGSASVIPGYIYDEINKGKPCIIYCQYGGGSSHYMVAYGWKKGTTRKNATYNSFYYIDPVTAAHQNFSGVYRAPSSKFQIISF